MRLGSRPKVESQTRKSGTLLCSRPFAGRFTESSGSCLPASRSIVDQDRNFLITAVELFRRSCVVVNIDRDPEGAP
jgi:hypothetical protein